MAISFVYAVRGYRRQMYFTSTTKVTYIARITKFRGHYATKNSTPGIRTHHACERQQPAQCINMINHRQILLKLSIFNIEVLIVYTTFASYSQRPHKAITGGRNPYHEYKQHTA